MYMMIYIYVCGVNLLQILSAGILSVCHGKSLVADLSILFIVVCVDNHLEGINSGGYSCYRHRGEAVATEPRRSWKYFSILIVPQESVFYQPSNLGKVSSHKCRECLQFELRAPEVEERPTH